MLGGEVLDPPVDLVDVTDADLFDEARLDLTDLVAEGASLCPLVPQLGGGLQGFLHY